MSTHRRSLGYVGTTMCLTAFVITVAAIAYASVVYANQRSATCGFSVGMLQVYFCTCGPLLCSVGFGGCALASNAGFTDRCWRLFRNVTTLLWAFAIVVLLMRP